MLSYKFLEKNAFGKYCRDCINYLFDLDIKQDDFLYYHGHHRCEYCGNLRHIVSGVKKWKRYKVWFGTKPIFIGQEEKKEKQ